MKRSAQLFRRAQELMPGGVNSPVRAFRSVGGQPLFIAKAKGARITDVDGKTYIDYVGSWTDDPRTRPPPDRECGPGCGTPGNEFRSPHRGGNPVARLVASRIPGVEQGAEAVLVTLGVKSPLPTTMFSDSSRVLLQV